VDEGRAILDKGKSKRQRIQGPHGEVAIQDQNRRLNIMDNSSRGKLSQTQQVFWVK